MKESPILFNGEMVRAILDGMKTQTRRAIPEKILEKYYSYDDWCDSVMPRDISCSRQYEKEYFMDRFPFGKVGDRLWVRETFWHALNWHTNINGELESHWDGRNVLGYDADGFSIGKRSCAKRPSIHMPRWASRITLEITNIRVERLQDISDEDAKAEGAPDYEEGVDAPPPDDGEYKWSYQRSFQNVWDSIYKNWSENPWVWAIEFKVINTTED